TIRPPVSAIAIVMLVVTFAEGLARGLAHALLEGALALFPFVALAAPFFALRAIRVAAALPLFEFRAVVLRLRLIATAVVVVVVDGEFITHTNTEFAHRRPSFEPHHLAINI